MPLVKLKVTYVDDRGNHPVNAEVEIDQAYLDRYPWVGEVVTESAAPSSVKPDPEAEPATAAEEPAPSPAPKKRRGKRGGGR